MKTNKSLLKEKRNLQRDLEKARRESAREEQKIQSLAEDTEDEMTFKERMERIRGAKKEDTEKKEKIDYTDDKNGIYLESALPSTMTVDIMPVESVKDGIVKTFDGQYLMILEIMPVNFLLKSFSEQADVISNFARFLKAGPREMQLKSLSKKADISRFIAKIEEEIKVEKDENCRRLQKDYEALIRTVGTREAVSRRFFLVFKYQRQSGRNSDYEEAVEQLGMYRARAVKYLKQCGNTVLIMDNSTEETLKIFFDLMNRNKHSIKKVKII